MPPDFNHLFNKVKNVTKQAADQTGRFARVAKLKANVLSLNAEKNRQFNAIGHRTYIFFTQENGEDGKLLKDRIQDEIAQINQIDTMITELNEQVTQIQDAPFAGNADIKDITE